MNIIYVKSAMAQKEFEEGNRSLSLKHRQLLIMVDGKRNDVEIAKIFNSDNAIHMLVDLEKLGYVINMRNLNVHKLNPNGMNHAEHTQTYAPAHIALIKLFLADEARLQLGLMSRDIQQKILNVRNTTELNSVISQWHMAIRDSKNGRTVADKLMEKLAHIMANPPQTDLAPLDQLRVNQSRADELRQVA